MSVEVGSPAPDFTLRNESGEEVTLSGLQGRNVVLIFYPFAFSSTCTKELHDVTDLESRFGDANAQVFGISVDSPFALKAFRDHEQLTPHLLSDFEPKGAVARQYGVYRGQDGTSERALFVIDGEGIVRWSYVSPVGVNPGADGILNALEALQIKGSLA